MSDIKDGKNVADKTVSTKPKTARKTVSNEAKKIKELEKQLSELTSMLTSLVEVNKKLEEEPKTACVEEETEQCDFDEDIIEIECNSTAGLYLDCNDSTVVVRLKDEETAIVSDSDMMALLKNNNIKKYLSKGLLKFTNEYFYKKYRIKKNNFISKDKIKNSLLNENFNQTRELFDKMIDGSELARNAVFYNIVKLWYDGEINSKNIEYSKIQKIKDYFGSSIENGVSRLVLLKTNYK